MMKKTLISFASFLTILILIGSFVAFHFIYSKPSGSSEEVVFEVSQGKSFTRVATELENMRLIQNAKLFSWYARFRGEAKKMKVGEYALRKDMAPAEVLAVITSGKSIGHPFTVAEGLNIYEIAELYQTQGFGTQEEFLKLCLDKDFVKLMLGEERDSLEGYLFPETYQLTKFTTTKELLEAMVFRFHEAYKQAEKNNKIPGWTRHQIVTLASIVEKETGAPEERPQISSVFHNRMQKGMLLQTDPTIIYGLADLAKKTVYKISKSDILKPTKYNTYVIKGLPPGPIGNPGRESLMAAMQPAKTDYLYFVSKNDGTHVFSQDYEAHSKAVRRLQMNPKAREGKSWRDLQKRPASNKPGT
ncbi:MAG: endolytic transglycosylase MltG [Pseudobdellovibrionaceae bacterium]